MEKTTTPIVLRVMTFNLRNSRAQDGANGWPNRRDIATDLIGRQNVDVLGVQEAFREQLDDVLRARPEYGEVGGGRDDGKQEGEHCQILYRRDRLELQEHGTFWFSDTSDVPDSRTWGNRNTRICTWTRLTDRQAQTAFYVYNLHIDHESQYSRERSIALLLEKIRQRPTADPVIVMGDFNAGEDNPILEMMKTQSDPPLQDTFQALHPDAPDAGTFHGFEGGTSGDKIDFIFSSSPFRVQDAAIVHDNRDGRFPSDHYPVIADLAPPACRSPPSLRFAQGPPSRGDSEKRIRSVTGPYLVLLLSYCRGLSEAYQEEAYQERMRRSAPENFCVETLLR